MSYDPISAALQLYQGTQQGGTGGAQRIAGGLSRLAPALVPELGQTQANQVGSTVGGAGNALGIYNGLQQGGVKGDVSAAANAAQLGERTGALPQTGVANDLSSVLGIYNGIEHGGVSGYGGAAVNAARLGSNLGVLPSAVGTAAGYVAAPLALYNAVNNWQSGATGSDALSGAEAGASIGSIVPGIGTLIGGLIGGGVGALSSAFGKGKKDAETSGFDQFNAAYAKDPSVISQVQNPFLNIAGLFDERSSDLPFYQQYGRMGEDKFTRALTGQINDAVAKGVIHPNDDVNTVMSKVVEPWIGTMAHGQGWKADASQPEIEQASDALIGSMVDQYIHGQAGNWKTVGGDEYGSKLQQFGAPQAAPAPAPTQVNPHMIGRQHFSGGGDVNFDDGNYDNLPTVEVDASPIPNGTTTDYSDPGSFDATTYQNPAYYPNGTTNDPVTPAQAGGGGGGGGASSGSSGLSGLLHSLLSNPKAIGALGGGLLGLLASTGGGGGNSKFSFNPPAPFAGTGPLAAGTSQYGNFSAQPRQQTHPTIDYAHYGEGPEASFFSPSPQQLHPLAASPPPASSSPVAPPQPVAGGGIYPPAPMPHPGIQPLPPTAQPQHWTGGPQSAAPTAPLALAAILNQARPQQSHPIYRPFVGMSPRAAGGSMGGAQTDSPLKAGLHVKGPGDGTSDDIPAMLSSGEYVIDAGTVSMLGNGDNDAGARALDNLRASVRKHAGKTLIKGKQFMQAKAPEAYLKGGDT